MKPTYRFISDPSRAWVEVPRKELDRLGITKDISSYSYEKDGMVYLEEDCDAVLWEKAKKARGEKINISEIYQYPTVIREYKRFSKNDARRIK